MNLEWTEEFPKDWGAGQSLIINDREYFSNFEFVDRGRSKTAPTVAAFSLTGRKWLWQLEQDTVAPMASDGKRLFILRGREIEAISTLDGGLLWQTAVLAERADHTDDELLSADGWLFYSSNQSGTGGLFALNSQTGAIGWKISLDSSLDWFKPNALTGSQRDEYRAVTYDRGRLFVRVTSDVMNGKFESKLLALDAASGRTLWDFPFEGRFREGDAPSYAASRPAFGPTAVYFGTYGGPAYALDRESGQVLWQRQVDMERPATFDGQLFAISGYQTVRALDATSGDSRWTLPFTEKGVGSLSPFVFVHNYLVFYAGTSDVGELSIVDTKSGRRIFALEPIVPGACDKAHPVAFATDGGNIYLATLNCLHAFSISW